MEVDIGLNLTKLLREDIVPMSIVLDIDYVGQFDSVQFLLTFQMIRMILETQDVHY